MLDLVMPTATTPVGHLPVTEQLLVQWLASADPGDQLVYHRGFLAIDTSLTASTLPPSRRAMLRQVASRALDMSDRGLVRAVQRRNGEGDFTYLLIAAHRLTVARRRLGDALPSLTQRGDAA